MGLMSWTTFLEAAPAANHAVQVYDDLAELAGLVGRYLDAGFRRGEPAVVISTSEHLKVFAADLEARGWRIERLEAEGLLVCRDAQQTLDGFMDGETPSAERFERVVGGLIDDVATQIPDKSIRAFGEMVDLLWKQGNEAGAIALEELWNELAETRSFALLCGYHLDIFDIDVQTSALPEIIRVHTHPRSAADTSRLAAAVDKALAEVLGPFEAGQIYLQVAEHVPRTQLPRAQAVLTWLSQQHSADARQVLDRVRTHYVSLRNAPSAQPAPRSA
jgi:MEDS: MEthanogen/methylotroph, DcmR Sensory domain